MQLQSLLPAKYRLPTKGLHDYRNFNPLLLGPACEHEVVEDEEKLGIELNGPPPCAANNPLAPFHDGLPWGQLLVRRTGSELGVDFAVG